MKKIISVILSMLMLLPLFSMCLTAQAEDDIPIVYIGGWGGEIITADGQRIFPLVYPDDNSSAIDWLDYLGLSGNVDYVDLILRIKDYIIGDEDALTEQEKESLFVQLFVSFLTESKEAYTQKFCDTVGRVYENFPLDKNGEPSDGSGVREEDFYTSYNIYGGIGMAVYKRNWPISGSRNLTVDYVNFDGRLSPMDNAETLREFLLAKGYTRIKLVSRCLACSTALAYLAKYGKDETVKVDEVVLYMPSFTGMTLLTALFTGEIYFDSGAVTDFVTYLNNNGTLSLGDESTDNLLKSVLGLADSSATMPLLLDLLDMFAHNYGSVLLPAMLKLCYAGCPGFWSMIAPEKYEQAKAFIFSDCTAEEKAEWAGMLAKTDAFHELQTNYKSILKDIEDSGIEISVIAKYGVPNFPVAADAHLEGDQWQTTDRQSMGATITNIDEKFSEEYIENGQYVSADGKIDASTCLFPNTTWFVKNCPHETYSNCFTALIEEILNTDGMTVNTNPEYTQYMDYHDATGTYNSGWGDLTPIVKAEDTDDATQTYDKSPLAKVKQLFLSLITKFINWVIGIFAGIKE